MHDFSPIRARLKPCRHLSVRVRRERERSYADCLMADNGRVSDVLYNSFDYELVNNAGE